MATTLNKTLFIGLGGTGATAILHTKKRFLDTYGEIPPMIEFLVIDTDNNTLTKSLERENILENHKNRNSKVSLEQSEFLGIYVENAQDTYQINKDELFDWMPDQNTHVLRNLMTGAGQVRSNGRFAIHSNQQKIAEIVNTKIANITNIANLSHTEFQEKGQQIEINFVYSIAGGTGSGAFIDVAYIVRNALRGNNKLNFVGFMVLPDVFNVMQQGITMINTKPNSFGALSELDFLMQNNINNYNLDLKFNNTTIQINENPFDIVFAINNTNTAGNAINHISKISEQIGLAMFTAASELSARVESVYDNIKTVLSGGGLNIHNKRAWACGMGVSELHYDGNNLGNIYARRVEVMMIDSILNTDTEKAPKLADDFIDHPEVQIRENKGNDCTIDHLLSATPNIQFEIREEKEANKEVDVYFNHIKETAEKTIEEKYNTKLKDVDNKLKDEINKIINDKNGVGNLKSFLEGMISQLDNFNFEMSNEENEFNEENSNIDLQIDSNLRTLKSLLDSSFRFIKKGEITNTKEGLEKLVNHKAKIIHEVLRRKYAQNLFNMLSSQIDDALKKLEIIINKLENIKVGIGREADNLRNRVDELENTFVIDLHKYDLENTYASKNDYIIQEFCPKLNLENGIFDFHAMDNKIIKNYFWNYAKELPKSLDFKNKTIDQVLASIDDEKKKEIANSLLTKSLALWKRNLHGFAVNHSIADTFVIGLPHLDSSFKNSFEELTDRNIEFVSTGIYNKVTCYRMEAAVPIFGVEGVSIYEMDYLKRKEGAANINFHIDSKWQARIERENLSIWPSIKEDNSLSLWVLGLIYKLIRFNKEKNKYEIYSEKEGDPLDDYWFDLNEYRDVAFDDFKRLKLYNEIEKSVEKKSQQAGTENTQALIADVKEKYKYEYAQMNLTLEDLRQPHYRSIADLLRKEIDFVTTELK